MQKEASAGFSDRHVEHFMCGRYEKCHWHLTKLVRRNDLAALRRMFAAADLFHQKWSLYLLEDPGAPKRICFRYWEPGQYSSRKLCIFVVV
jgi:hypothetical protein